MSTGDPHGVGGGTATTFKMAIEHNLLIYQYVPQESRFQVVEPANQYYQLSLF
jgi:hypothetical protein